MSNSLIGNQEGIPCWYEPTLKGDKKDKKIIIKVHSSVINSSKQFPGNNPHVVDCLKRLGLNVFAGKLGEDFGFDRTLKCLGEKDNFFEYLIPIPLVKWKSDDPCPSCKGGEAVTKTSCVCREGKVITYNTHQIEIV